MKNFSNWLFDIAVCVAAWYFQIENASNLFAPHDIRIIRKSHDIRITLIVESRRSEIFKIFPLNPFFTYNDVDPVTKLESFRALNTLKSVL